MTAAVYQPGFAAALRDPARPAVASLRGGTLPDRARRFAVHRNNFVASLVDALAAGFPVTQALVGEDFFRAMARERVLQQPPRSPVLIDYVEGFADFIADFGPAATVPYLADVARVEALRVRAFHAADARPLPETAYRELAASPAALANTRLSIHPSCHWMRSRHAAYSIWRAHQGPDPAGALGDVDVDRPEDVLVTRAVFDVAVVALPRGAYEFLEAVRAGLTLATAFHAADAFGAGVDCGELFSLLIRHGLVVSAHMQPGDLT